MTSLQEIQQELNSALDALREKAPTLTRLFELLREEQEQLYALRYPLPSIQVTPDWTYRPPTPIYPFNPFWVTTNNASASFTINPTTSSTMLMVGSSEPEIIPSVWPSTEEMKDGDGEGKSEDDGLLPSGA